MAAIVRISAVLVGLANIYALLAVGMWFAATGAEELEGINGFHFLQGFFIATVVGLLTAEILLRLARGMLRGHFFARYAAMALGMCLGGVLTILLPVLCFAAAVTVTDSLREAGSVLSATTPLTMLSGATGLIEGVVLAFPLAAMLGKFRDTPGASQPNPTP